MSRSKVTLTLPSGRAALVEPQDVAAPGPGGAPELAVEGERQVADAHVAEVAEGLRDRVEDLDAVARGDEEAARRRLDGHGLRDAVAELGEDGARLRVQAEQRPAAGGRPEVAGRVQGHVEDRERQAGEGLAGRP